MDHPDGLGLVDLTAHVLFRDSVELPIEFPMVPRLPFQFLHRVLEQVFSPPHGRISLLV